MAGRVCNSISEKSEEEGEKNLSFWSSIKKG